MSKGSSASEVTHRALAAFVKRAARSPLLNAVTKEAALHLAVHFASLEGMRVWSELNECADSL